MSEPMTVRDICLEAMNHAVAIGSDWSLKGPRRPGDPFVIKIWEPVPKEPAPEEKGQMAIPGCEENS